jgi:O-methyltransferase
MLRRWPAGPYVGTVRIRTRVNRVINRATGYQLVRTGPKPPAPPGPSAGKPPGSAKPRASAPGRRRPASLPSDYDQETREIWEAVRDRTMTHHTRVHFLVQAVRYVDRHRVPGAIVECGVWRGGSMLTVAHTLLRLGVADRDLYLFDTFEGMTAPTERDVRITQGKHADELLAAKGPGPMAWARPGRFVATLDDVKEGFAALDYPEDRVHFVPGRVEDTVPQQAPEGIAILRLDTDWYESTKHELTHLYKRLAPGGVLIIDDYGTWHGSKEATDEFLDETREPLLLTRVSRAAVAVKPGLRSAV